METFSSQYKKIFYILLVIRKKSYIEGDVDSGSFCKFSGKLFSKIPGNSGKNCTQVRENLLLSRKWVEKAVDFRKYFNILKYLT